MSLSDLLQRVVDLLDDAGISYMLTGSLAAAYYSAPRATKDIDIVLETDASGIGRLVEALSEAGLYVDHGAALEALGTQGQFNAIDSESGWKIDLIVRKARPFSKAEFARRRRAEIFGIEVWIATLEDVVIAKLEWGALGDSDLQRSDVVQLLERAGSQIDVEYTARWASELGLDSEWEAARARADPAGGGPPSD